MDAYDQVNLACLEAEADSLYEASDTESHGTFVTSSAVDIIDVDDLNVANLEAEAASLLGTTSLNEPSPLLEHKLKVFVTGSRARSGTVECTANDNCYITDELVLDLEVEAEADSPIAESQQVAIHPELTVLFLVLSCQFNVSRWMRRKPLNTNLCDALSKKLKLCNCRKSWRYPNFLTGSAPVLPTSA